MQIIASGIHAHNSTLHSRAPCLMKMKYVVFVDGCLSQLKLDSIRGGNAIRTSYVPHCVNRAPACVCSAFVAQFAQLSLGMFRRPSAASSGEDDVELDGIPLADFKSRGQCCSAEKAGLVRTIFSAVQLHLHRTLSRVQNI